MRNRDYAVLGGLLMLVAGSRMAIGGAYEDAMVAVRGERADIVVNLVRRGLDPNTADISGTTLLMVAARNGNAALLDFLLRSGANAMNQNMYGDTVIGLAALHGHERGVQRLGDAGATSDGPAGGLCTMPPIAATPRSFGSCSHVG